MNSDVTLPRRRLHPGARTVDCYLSAFRMSSQWPMYSSGDDVTRTALRVDRHGFADGDITGSRECFDVPGFADRDCPAGFGFDSGACHVANDDAAGSCMNACASADVARLDRAGTS